MRAWRYAVAGAAICVGVFVVPVAAIPAPQTPQPAQAVPPAQAPQPTPQSLQAVPPAQTPQPMPPVRAGRRPEPGQTAPPAQRANWDQLGLRGFSVALVVGDLTGASAADNLPAGAKKALSDMRDFLPYKSYRLLDTHWILCCSGTRDDASVSGRLRGAEEEEYVFYINVRSGYDSADLGVNFTLRETGAAYADVAATSVVTSTDRSRRRAELVRDREEAEKRASQGSEADRAAARADYEALKRKIAELERSAQQTRVASRSGGARHVLDSTFSMKVGETVVIGTSRLKGDKALIALLTAASRSGAASPRESR